MPIEVQGHVLPFWKPQINMSWDLDCQRYFSTLNLCQTMLKNGILLNKYFFSVVFSGLLRLIGVIGERCMGVLIVCAEYAFAHSFLGTHHLHSRRFRVLNLPVRQIFQFVIDFHTRSNIHIDSPELI